MVKYLKTVIFFMGMFFFSCENFLTGPLLDQNPNEVDDVTVVSPEALLVGTQVTMYGVMEGYLNRAVSMVMQQMSGLQTDYYRDYNRDGNLDYNRGYQGYAIPAAGCWLPGLVLAASCRAGHFFICCFLFENIAHSPDLFCYEIFYTS